MEDKSHESSFCLYSSPCSCSSLFNEYHAADRESASAVIGDFYEIAMECIVTAVVQSQGRVDNNVQSMHTVESESRCAN